MSFVVIGLNHATAPLDVLEQVTVAPDDLDKALHDLLLRPYVSEGVVLSTCNRTEVYILAERFHGAFQDVRDFLSQISFVAPETLNDHLYTFYDDQAIEHLFRVSAGVDSAVLGENEILGQIKRAWESAQNQDCVGMSLNSIFRAAVAVGKRVRTETSISRSIASVSQAAIVMAEERRGSLAGQHVLLIGAGEMGGGMAKTLATRGTASLTVMSRTQATAVDIAEQIGAQVRPFEELDQALGACDVAFTSTASPGMVVDVAMVSPLLDQRSNDLLILDVAMPRDVAAGVGELPGVELCDLDAIGAFVAKGLESRAGEVEQVNQIIADEMLRHLSEVGKQSVSPLITSFRSQVESLRSDEMVRQANKLGDLTPEQRAAVDEATRAVLNKVIHEPTMRLKDSANSLRGERLAAALRELFDLQ
ncbi:MAG: glutamyl-tRNA reductase [Acidimicrobiales bacterium]|jgi:glutamyl-tRNA reductase